MSVTISTTNKPLNPRAQDLSPKGYNRASLYSGKALDFDGVNDYVTFDGFAGTLSNNDAWTACGYFKTSNVNRGTWFSAHNSNGGNILRIGTEGGNESGLFYADSYQFDTQIGDFDFRDDKMHFVVLSRAQGANGSLATLFVDGIELATQVTGPNWDTATKFSLGQEWDGGSTSDFWDGLLANFKIFNTALTAAQVSDLYLNPEKIVPDGVANSALKLWLPMMEGAGTTAYDGSGNGNDGTILGATWTSGVGAPVAQTALVGWNKGTNLVLYSEQFDYGYWSKGTGVSVVANNATAPNGTRTADTVTFTSGGTGQFLRAGITLTGGTSYAISVYARLVSGNSTLSFDIQNAESTSFTVTSSWQRFSWVVTPSATRTWFDIQLSGAGGGVVEFWGAQVTATSTLQPYIPTIATAQTSPVLLPQGLTANKDITGVNSFENPRNAYALNLDGASWAEVHDNASLDITSAITLEAWVYWDGTTAKGIFGRWDLVNNKRSYLLYTSTPARFNFFVSSNGTLNTNQQNNTDISTGWNHIVGVYDGANIITYLNGSADGSKAYSSDIYATDVDIEIGRYDLNPANAYPNDIALPRIYNRALTATEVSRNYNADKSKFGL